MQLHQEEQQQLRIARQRRVAIWGSELIHLWPGMVSLKQGLQYKEGKKGNHLSTGIKL
jgi:hypothetical protein